MRFWSALAMFSFLLAMAFPDMVGANGLDASQPSGPPPVVAPPAPPVIEGEMIGQQDREFCAAGRKIVDAAQADLPIRIDPITTTTGMAIICGLRSFTVSQMIHADQADMRDGWRDRKQDQYNKIVCSNEAFLPAFQRGWRFTQSITFKSGERHILEASCPMKLPSER